MVKISVELDSTNFCTGHDVPPAKYSSYQLLKLKPRLFTQPVGWVETVRVRRPRASAFYQQQLFANPSDRPTRGPVDLSPSDFHKRWNLIGGRLCCLSLVSGATIFYFPDKAGGKVVATWWLPQLPYTKSGGLEEHTPILKTTRDQISAKEKLQ